MTDTKCPICYDMFTDPVKIQCGHTFCKLCWNKHAAYTIKATCPMCRLPDPIPTPDLEASDIVKCIPREQPCACVVSDEDMREHKNTCVEYWKCATKTWMATATNVHRKMDHKMDHARKEYSTMKRKRDALQDTCAKLEQELRSLRQKVDHDRLRADRQARRMTH